MHPVVALAIALYQQLVEVLLTIIGCIKQDGGITNGLLYARTSYIHSAARQVVARMRPAYTSVHFRRTVATRDNDGLLFPS